MRSANIAESRLTGISFALAAGDIG